VIISVAAVEALRKKKRQDETQFTTKIGGKTHIWVPAISFGKIFILSYAFDGLLCRNQPFPPPNNHLTLCAWVPFNVFVFQFSHVTTPKVAISHKRI
jgi:hypothetical protein